MLLVQNNNFFFVPAASFLAYPSSSFVKEVLLVGRRGRDCFVSKIIV